MHTDTDTHEFRKLIELSGCQKEYFAVFFFPALCTQGSNPTKVALPFILLDFSK